MQFAMFINEPAQLGFSFMHEHFCVVYLIFPYFSQVCVLEYSWKQWWSF